MSQIEDNLAFCQTELKKIDPVRHFAALTANPQHRPAVFAFYAFLAEISRIPKLVSDPSIGEIRLQWWRDILGDASESRNLGASNIGPLAAAVKDTQIRYNLSVDTLLQIIDARTFDLYNDPMPDMPTYEAYAGETESLPILLIAQILNGGELPQDLSDLCGHAGMTIALANHLFDWPKAAKMQKLFLPKSVFLDQGVETHKIFKGIETPELHKAITTCVELGNQHFFKAMAHYQGLKGDAMQHLAPAFLLMAPAKLQLNKRAKNPTAEQHIANWRAYWSVWRMAALG